MQLAPSLHRLGTASLVNSYLLEDAGAITVIDAGLRGHWNDLLRELEAMGRSLVDIRALLLTHADVDHVGFAERLRQENGVPVFVVGSVLSDHACTDARQASRWPGDGQPCNWWNPVIRVRAGPRRCRGVR
jgi:glyoxylase-like metal-dependent hydrolase (beta-lactamase superfamily II)